VWGENGEFEIDVDESNFDPRTAPCVLRVLGASDAGAYETPLNEVEARYEASGWSGPAKSWVKVWLPRGGTHQKPPSGGP
jgi:hypothetical protein